MNSNENNTRRARRGFTLIELLVVVVIIGILAAIATPIYLNQRRAAWKAAAVSDATNAVLAVETARTKTGTLDGMTFTPGTSPSPMVVAVGTETVKAPTSPSDTLTAWTGMDADGNSCYAVMATNANLPGWAAVRTDSKLTTGTPPETGSAECPKPGPSYANHTVGITLALSPLDSGGPLTLEITSDGAGSNIHMASGSTPVLGSRWKLGTPAVRYGAPADPSVKIASINGADPTSLRSPDTPLVWGPSLRVVLTNGAVITIDTSAADPSAWTVSYTTA